MWLLRHYLLAGASVFNERNLDFDYRALPSKPVLKSRESLSLLNLKNWALNFALRLRQRQRPQLLVLLSLSSCSCQILTF